ncbi:hypothetical protein [Clavibacter michiganensis]|uniref:hypothetical protein n=1 Tax=Clavibacter michiganensis TaxID=28447 RepID=UPI0011AFFF0F|nr:hypothetical protein [Clavibacter michiganensis]
MPNRSVRSRQATELQRLTRLPYSRAAALLRDDRGRLEPTRDQAQLEGRVFDGFRSLAYGPTPGTVTASIARVEPARSSITIHPGTGFDLSDLAAGVTPVFEDDSFVNGIPALRLASHPLGATLHRPGIDAAVIFAGIRFSAWLKTLRSDDPAVRFVPLGMITAQERDALGSEERRCSVFSSLLLRRVGMLDALRATSIHMYGSHRGRILEVIQPHVDPAGREAFIQDMALSGLRLAAVRPLGGESLLLDFATDDERDGAFSVRLVHRPLDQDGL